MSMPNRRRHVSALATACAFSDFTVWNMDLQVVDGGLVDFRCPRCSNSTISCSAVSKLPVRNSHSARSSRRLNINSYWLLPVSFVQQRHAGARYTQRRRIGRRRLGLSPGTQVDRRHLRLLVPVDQPCGAAIELVRHIEQMLGELVRRHARQQRTADAQVDLGTLLVGNQ